MKTTREERAKFRGANGIGVPYHTFIWALIDDIEELLKGETGPVQVIEYQQRMRAEEISKLSQLATGYRLERNIMQQQAIDAEKRVDELEEQIKRLYELLHAEERRATAYKNLMLELATELDDLVGISGTYYHGLIANLDKLLAQEEAQEKK